MTAPAVDQGWTDERSAAGRYNRWLIVGILSIATFMEVLDTSIANVALRHIAGSLAASLEESTWVITSYLVSNAVILPVSGWLSEVMGRKRFYMMSVALFTVCSLLCGLAPNLGFLIVARILQGLGGGGLAPSEQSMLADTFPPSQRTKAFALYGVAVIVAPALGPTIGGYITDNASWHWIFFINVPMGILSLVLVGLFVTEPKVLQRERRSLLRRGLKIDWVGFLLVALTLGFLEIVLDKGQEDDWFSSGFITTCAIISALSFCAFVPWELTRKQPIVNIRLLAYRQFSTCCAIMLAVGAILFSSTQFMPQLLQENYGYTATLAGLALMPGGLAALVMAIVVGQISGYVQPKYMLAFALIVLAAALYHFTGLSPEADFTWFATARTFQIGALPVLFLTITSVSYVGLPPDKTSQASALINVARNLGGSLGVSMAQTLLARREQFHQSRLVENFAPSSIPYQDTLSRAAHHFVDLGASPADGQQMAVASIGKVLADQVALLSYIDVFAALALFAALMVPLAFFVQDIGHKGRGA